MSDSVILAIISAIPATVTAFAMGLRNGWKSDDISHKADIIHELTNSNLTAVKVALANAEAKIERLEKILEARP